jgi:hypothetical protein
MQFLSKVTRRTGTKRTYYNIGEGAMVICSSGVIRQPEIRFIGGAVMKLRDTSLDINL